MPEYPMTKLDLPEGEGNPTEKADPLVHRTTYRESSIFSLNLDVWKARFYFQYRVQGPHSWAPLLCVAVLLIALTAALIVPSLLLPVGSAGTIVAIFASVSGGVVLLGGAAFLALWLKRRL